MTFNKYQEEAINTSHKDVIIVAPPGSGKTHTMTGAITKYLNENPINNGITAITFTNKAADELKERLQKDSISIHIATIHSWSYTELYRLSEKHGFRMRVLSEDAIKDILLGFMPKYNVREQYINAVYSFALGNMNPDLPIWISSKYRAIRDSYIEYKRKMHLYDFTDYPLYLSDQLEKYNENIYIDAIFVDEFQDVDPIQLDVFNKVVSKKKFFIGDPDQAIYQFRGATDEIFERLKGYYEYTLYENYRSYQEIIDYSFAIKNDGENNRLPVNAVPSKVRASRGSGGIIYYNDRMQETIMKYSNKGHEVVQIFREFLDVIKKNHFTVLCRTNREVKQSKELGFLDSMTIHQAKGLEFDNVIVLQFDDKSSEDTNVRFVANTRAKNILVNITMDTLNAISKRIGNGITKGF